MKYLSKLGFNWKAVNQNFRSTDVRSIEWKIQDKWTFQRTIPFKMEYADRILFIKDKLDIPLKQLAEKIYSSLRKIILMMIKRVRLKRNMWKVS